MFGKNGYSRLPTEDPGKAERVEGEACGKRGPRDLRPGVFYMFGQRARYAAAHSESEEMELSEVKLPAHRRPKHRRHKSPKSPKTPTSAGKGFRPRFTLIEEPILPGDTVQRVALRYSCPDAEIRRVNNLYCDQDFFALKMVKIPVRENSALTEVEELEKRRRGAAAAAATVTGTASSNQSSSTGDEMRLGGPGTYYRSDEESSCDADDEKGESDGPEYRDISIQSALRWKCSNHTVLEKLDEELQRAREENDQRLMSLREVAVMLDSPAIYPVMSPKALSDRSLLQSLDWRLMVGGFFVLVVILLVFFFVKHWSHLF